MRTDAVRRSVVLVAVLLLPLLGLVAEEAVSLVIDGPQGQAKVIQVQGKNVIGLEDVARITGGSLRFVGNQIILTLPNKGESPDAAPDLPPGLSKPFLTVGIETMREILEWRAALKAGIERGLPLSDDWFAVYRRQIQSSLKQAEAAATSDTDKTALPLLVNEFNNMSTLTDKYLRITTNRDYLAPDSLNNDPLDKKVVACWRSMEWIAASNQIVDDGACQ